MNNKVLTITLGVLVVGLVIVSGCTGGGTDSSSKCAGASFDFRPYEGGHKCLVIDSGKELQVDVIVENAKGVEDFKIEAIYEDGTTKSTSVRKTVLSDVRNIYSLTGSIADTGAKISSARIIPTKCPEIAKTVDCKS